MTGTDPNWLYGYVSSTCILHPSPSFFCISKQWIKSLSHSHTNGRIDIVHFSYWVMLMLVLVFIFCVLSGGCPQFVLFFRFVSAAALNVTEFCSDRLNEIDDVWDVKSLHVFQTLNDITDVIESWIQVCDSLTRLFWPNYARHAWIGGPHIPKTATLYLKRLHAIQAIRNVYKEIVSLFNEINQIDKSVRRIFVPFRGG